MKLINLIVTLITFFIVILPEDDTSISTEVKVPILLGFHRLIYDKQWKFSCELVTIVPFVLWDKSLINTQTIRNFRSYQ